MQRLCPTSTTTGKKKQGYPQDIITQIAEGMIYCQWRVSTQEAHLKGELSASWLRRFRILQILARSELRGPSPLSAAYAANASPSRAERGKRRLGCSQFLFVSNIKIDVLIEYQEDHCICLYAPSQRKSGFSIPAAVCHCF